MEKFWVVIKMKCPVCGIEIFDDGWEHDVHSSSQWLELWKENIKIISNLELKNRKLQSEIGKMETDVIKTEIKLLKGIKILEGN